MNANEKFQKVIELCEKQNVSADKVSAWYDNERFFDDMMDSFPEENVDEKYGVAWKDLASAEVISQSIIEAENCLQSEISEGDFTNYAAGWPGVFAAKHPDIV